MLEARPLLHAPAPRRARGCAIALATAGALAIAAIAAPRARPVAALAAAAPASENRSAAHGLGFVARTRGYDALPRHTIDVALRARWSHIVEPHKPTVLTATSSTSDAAGGGPTYSWRVGVAGGAARVLEGASVVIVFDAPGSVYFVELVEERAVGARTAARRAVVRTDRVACRYVRREMRSLSTEDRDAYLDAMREIYELSDAAGRARYGANFRSGAYFTAKHASSDFCYHGNLAFLTTHPAFTLELERSLRSVNASVAATYWDFTRDHALGAGWVRAAPYTDEWFGSVDNGAADGYRPRGGRFAQVATVYDPNRTWARAHHNAFGFLASEENPMNSRVLQRTAEVCGHTSAQPPASCSRLVACFANYTTLDAFDLCLEADVHANLHGMNAGMWDCGVDVNASAANITGASAGLVSFIFATITDVVSKYPKCEIHTHIAHTSARALAVDAILRRSPPSLARAPSRALRALSSGTFRTSTAHRTARSAARASTSAGACRRSRSRSTTCPTSRCTST